MTSSPVTMIRAERHSYGREPVWAANGNPHRLGRTRRTRPPTISRVLTRKIVGCHRGVVRDIAVIEDPAAAGVIWQTR
jgi:hypothetical protein